MAPGPAPGGTVNTTAVPLFICCEIVSPGLAFVGI